MFAEIKQLKSQIEKNKAEGVLLSKEYERQKALTYGYLRAILDVVVAQLFPEWTEQSIAAPFNTYTFEYSKDGVIVKYTHFMADDYLPYTGDRSKEYFVHIPAKSFEMIQGPSDQIGELLDGAVIMKSFEEFVKSHGNYTLQTCFAPWKQTENL